MRIKAVSVFACVVAVLATAAVAFARTNSVKISLNPTSGKYGTIYKIDLSGRASRSGDQVALSMVTTPSHKCPSSYAAGFSELSGLANSSGKPMAPIRVRKGRFSRIVKAKLTISSPGAYSICAYLNRGSATKAHASAVMTVTG